MSPQENDVPIRTPIYSANFNSYVNKYFVTNPVPPTDSIIEIIVLEQATAPTIADGVLSFFIPNAYSGKKIKDAQACVNTPSTSGLPSVALYNVRKTADILSTNITIDINEQTSYTAATPSVVDATNNDLLTGDEIRIDVDAIGTNTKGLIVILVIG